MFWRLWARAYPRRYKPYAGIAPFATWNNFLSRCPAQASPADDAADGTASTVRTPRAQTPTPPSWLTRCSSSFNNISSQMWSGAAGCRISGGDRPGEGVEERWPTTTITIPLSGNLNAGRWRLLSVPRWLEAQLCCSALTSMSRQPSRPCRPAPDPLARRRGPQRAENGASLKQNTYDVRGSNPVQQRHSPGALGQKRLVAGRLALSRRSSGGPASSGDSGIRSCCSLWVCRCTAQAGRWRRSRHDADRQ